MYAHLDAPKEANPCRALVIVAENVDTESFLSVFFLQMTFLTCFSRDNRNLTAGYAA